MEVTINFDILVITVLLILGIICIGLIILTYLLVSPRTRIQNNSDSDNDEVQDQTPVLEDRELTTSLTFWGLGLMVVFFAVSDILNNKLGLLIPGIFFIFVGYPGVRRFIRKHKIMAFVITLIVIIITFIINYF